MPASEPETFVVVPAYNERDNIEELLEGIRRYLPGGQIVVVDDSSPDGTGDLVRRYAQSAKNVHLLARPGKLGFASACLDGIRFALERGADRVIMMDADLSHDPSALPSICRALDSLDVVLGSRYVPGGRLIGFPLARRAVSTTANILSRCLAGIPARDCTTGYRGYRSELLRRVPLHRLRARGFGIQTEILFQCLREGAALGEVPITFVNRQRGRSKISIRMILEAIGLHLRLCAARLSICRRSRTG
jgi:dolichol-phosphate mannosyltransferase